ncbi:MAG TPA: GTPase HflX, partial [Anaeromyxobacter sp.]
GGVAVSAATRDGLPALLHACDRILWADGRVAFAEVEAGAPPPEPVVPAEPRPVVHPPTGEPAEPPRLLPASLRRVS